MQLRIEQRQKRNRHKHLTHLSIISPLLAPAPPLLPCATAAADVRTKTNLIFIQSNLFVALKHSPSKRKSLSRAAAQRSQDADSDAHRKCGIHLIVFAYFFHNFVLFVLFFYLLIYFTITIMKNRKASSKTSHNRYIYHYHYHSTTTKKHVNHVNF